MTSLKRVIRLERNGPAETGMPEIQCDPADFQSPAPAQHLHVYYTEPEIGLNVGVWDTTTMQEAFGPYPGDEFIWVLEGVFKMIDVDGKAIEVNEGESVCFRNAIPISWKQDGYLKKFYITFRDPNADTLELSSAKNGVLILNRDAELIPGKANNLFEIDGQKPLQREQVVFTNDTGNMFVGVWDSEAMLSKMRPFPTHEFVQMLEGEVTVTEQDGRAQTFVAGDCFFVPKGTVCSWKIDRYVKKYFAVLNTE